MAIDKLFNYILYDAKIFPINTKSINRQQIVVKLLLYSKIYRQTKKHFTIFSFTFAAIL